MRGLRWGVHVRHDYPARAAVQNSRYVARRWACHTSVHCDAGADACARNLSKLADAQGPVLHVNNNKVKTRATREQHRF